jgi:Insertion element 4 transposase N-terminal/Transposase DDE domain
MPKPPNNLPVGVRITDKIAFAQFAKCFPRDAVEEVLIESSRQSKRIRELPNDIVVYFVMMLGLFRDSSHSEVLRCAMEGLHWLLGIMLPKVTGKSGIAQARMRVGWEPMKKLFDRFAVPIAKPGSKGSFYRQWRVTAIDGSIFDVDDSLKNDEYFGRSSNQTSKRGPYPQARLLSLVECGTHIMFAAAIGGYKDSEVALARKVLPQLQKDMLLIADRVFFGFDLFKQASETGAALLWRMRKGVKLVPEGDLSDGSHIGTIYSSADQKKETGMRVRFFEYEVVGSKDAELYTMITNILDPQQAPALELAALYRERWEFETVLDEVKTHLNAKTIVLRSKTPDLVKQELYGLIMAHYAVRAVMFEAAMQKDLDPDDLSFIHSVRVIRRKLTSLSSFPPEGYTPSYV